MNFEQVGTLKMEEAHQKSRKQTNKSKNKSDWTRWSVCPGLIFFVFSFFVLFGVLLTGMVNSSLLLKDELLTPDIDGVMAL